MMAAVPSPPKCHTVLTCGPPNGSDFMSRCRTVFVFLVLAISSGAQIATRADIYRWDNGKLIPGTEGIEPGPGWI